jgi:hypothetical protein
MMGHVACYAQATGPVPTACAHVLEGEHWLHGQRGSPQAVIPSFLIIVAS